MSVDIILALKWNPFSGDFGEPDDRMLSDKIVKVRKQFGCCWCKKTISIGEITRSRVDVLYGKIHCYRYCNTCTQLMAKAAAHTDYRSSEKAEAELENRLK